MKKRPKDRHLWKLTPNWMMLFLGIVFLSGGSTATFMMYDEAALADPDHQQVFALTICVTIIMTGIFLIAAFNRYRFTHLWQKH